jgi:PST family polysaccharide transporter
VKPEQQSYSKILSATSLIGGAEGARLLIGIVQTKFVAILLGPVGVGLAGTFGSLLGLVSRISGLGIAGSGVREVAEASASGDEQKIGRTVLTVRRVSWLTGLAGSVALALLARPLSRLTFGSEDHAWALMLLAWVVLIRAIQSAQMAVLQGRRRIGDLARLKIVGGAGGAVIAIALYAWLRLDGIVPAIIVLAIFNLVLASWYARRLAIEPVVMSWRETLSDAGGLVGLGLALMWTGFLIALVAYATRVLIVREFDLEAAGLYQSSFRLSGMFVGFILGAMATDYFPRLTEKSNDDGAMSRLVNEQTEIGLLLALPGLLATVALAPWIIRVFYTAEFAGAAELLQWFVLGCLGRVISWPMGFVLLAKGESRWFALTESMAAALHLVLIWVGLKSVGIEGVAMAFVALYVVYTLLMLVVTRYLIGFAWSPTTLRLLAFAIPSVGAGFLAPVLLRDAAATVAGLAATLIVGVLCLRGLVQRVGPEHRISKAVRLIPGFGRVAGTDGEVR